MMDHFERLADAASAAQGMLMRGGKEGSLTAKIQRGEWNRDLTPQQATDLADLLYAMAENVRYTRVLADRLRCDPFPCSTTVGHLEDVVAKGLPLNRKERFYTGTVLPMIVAGDGFAHLHRFLALCGLQIEPLDYNALEGEASIEFFTEYNFAESRFTAGDKERFSDAPIEADTPDLVIVGPDWLVAVEAKMFHNPSASALNEQMRRQRVLVDYWVGQLHISADRVSHVLLLPLGLSTTGLKHVPVTWESVLAEYQFIGPAYWTSMLETALKRYDELRSRGTFGLNPDDHMTGTEIVEAHSLGELEYAYMGRLGGLNGKPLAKDLESRDWRYRTYEVRYEPLPGKPHWFAIAEFIARTAL